MGGSRRHPLRPRAHRHLVVGDDDGHGGGGQLPDMLVVRFLFGAGEAGAWPGVARTFSRWIPQPERGRVQGIFFCGAHLVAGLTPAFIVGGGLLGPWPGLLSVMSWRGVFVTFGFVGLAWVAIWLYWFRNDPSEHPSVSSVGAGADRRQPEARHRARRRLDLLADADPQPEHDRAQHHVHPELHDLLLLHHLAAVVPARAPRLQHLGHGALRRAAAAGQHAGRSARRLADRPSVQPLRPPRRPLRTRRRSPTSSSAAASSRRPTVATPVLAAVLIAAAPA